MTPPRIGRLPHALGMMMKNGLALLLMCSAPALAAAMQSAKFEACYARWDTQQLVIGNAHVERAWKVAGGLLYAASFRDIESGREWIARSSARPAPYPKAAPAGNSAALIFSSRSGRLGPVEAASLEVELKAERMTYRFQIFPNARGVVLQLLSTGDGSNGDRATRAAEAAPTGIETAARKVAAAGPLADALEDLDLNVAHARFTQVTLLDQTDAHNELVFEREWLLHPNERSVRVEGNLFFLEDTLKSSGLVFLKEAPLPHARPIPDAYDAEASWRGQGVRCTFAGHGIEPAGGAGYRYVLLAYNGGRVGRIEALQSFQRQVRPYDPQRDAMFLSNTWGDRSRDLRINADFMTKEVEAGARLGVDVIQIDDGWQHGRTANSGRGSGGAWNGFWAFDPNFWIPDTTRFPAGLDPLVRQAADKGMRFGLWFAPDSSNDFANWERDSARLLELHRTNGIDYFKIDGVKATSKASERNLQRLFDRVLNETKGKVVFDLDVTAEIRPGYFGMMDVGPVFIENRYTDSHRYWPHQTLRNLWKLTQYLDPVRLRVEFLNNARNAALYEQDPLAPAKYSPAYLFATTMFASPLGWFELSNLPPAFVDETAKLVAAWKQHREALFSGTITPIGAAPDGVAWTGFVSAGKQGGYVLVFRGVGGAPEWTEKLPMFAAREYAVDVLGGKGSARLANGELRVSLPDAPGFLWVRVQGRP